MEVSQNINQVELNITLNGDVEPVVIDGQDSYPRNEYVTFTPLVDKSGVDFTNFTLEYTLIDPLGDVITPDISGNNISFDLEYLGTYLVKIQLTDNDDGLIYNVIYKVESVNYLKIEQTGCNTFEFTNNGSVDIQLEVLDLFNETLGVPNEALPSQTLPSGESVEVVLEDISLYIVNTTYTINQVERVENYILNNYCLIEECITSYILDILCSEEAQCVDCPDGVDLNRMLALNYAYFMQVNNEYGLNNFYSGIDHQDARNKFQDIKNIMDKLWKYCERRNCTGTEGVPSPYTTNDCGCNG